MHLLCGTETELAGCGLLTTHTVQSLSTVNTVDSARADKRFGVSALNVQAFSDASAKAAFLAPQHSYV